MHKEVHLFELNSKENKETFFRNVFSFQKMLKNLFDKFLNLYNFTFFFIFFSKWVLQSFRSQNLFEKGKKYLKPIYENYKICNECNNTLIKILFF